MTENFAPLFDSRGTFTGYDEATLAALTPQRRSLYDAVADAAAVMTQADAELKAATDNVRACMDAVSDAEKRQPARMTQHQLWKETFGRPWIK